MQNLQCRNINKESVLDLHILIKILCCRPQDLVINYLAHMPSGGSMGPIDLSPTADENSYQSISNAPLPTPLNKSTEGLKLFQDVINRLDCVDKKDKLVENLIKFAKTDTKYKRCKIFWRE